MTVLLTVSETFDGSQIADALATPSGPANTGIDLGAVVNGSYAPIISKAANTGHQKLYIRHDAVIDPITQVRTFIQTYGVGTSFAYGGADSAAGNFTTLKSLANASGSSKNNNDGLSGGLWADMDADAVTANQFDQANFPTLVKIYGDNLTDGIDLASAFTMKANALVIDTNQSAGADGDGAFLPSAPVDGQIGKNGDGVLGDNAKVRMRIYLPTAYSNGGYHQVEWVIAYSFTA